MSERNPHAANTTGTTAQNPPGRMLPQEFQALDLAFLGSLLPGIIHNLATPLSGVLGATQLLEKRASTIEDMFEQLESLSAAERGELDKQFERNRTNVDILSRNAKHLADLLQVLVQRINRCSGCTPEYYSLNDLLQNEIRFLDSNLSFKHKVKKQVTLAPNMPTVKYIYGHVAAALDEFVSSSILLHDFNRGLSEMEFSTVSDSDSEAVMIAVTAHLIFRQPEADISGPLESHLERLRDEGWLTRCSSTETLRELVLSHPRPEGGA